MSKLSKSLLAIYKHEYETNHTLTIQQLCDKYNVTTKQLTGYTKWKKQERPTETKLTSSKANIVEKDILDKIEEFKKLAIDNALHFIKVDAKTAEIKEFKDVVAIVDSIEKSYSGSQDIQANQYNIAIQNIINKYA